MGISVKNPVEAIQIIGAGIRTTILDGFKCPGYFKMKVNVATRELIRLELFIHKETHMKTYIRIHRFIHGTILTIYMREFTEGKGR